MFDSGGSGLDRVVAAFADLTGCDPTALADPGRRTTDPDHSDAVT